MKEVGRRKKKSMAYEIERVIKQGSMSGKGKNDGKQGEVGRASWKARRVVQDEKCTDGSEKVAGCLAGAQGRHYLLAWKR